MLVAQQTWDLSTQERIFVTVGMVVLALAIFWVIKRIGNSTVQRLSGRGKEEAERYQTLWSVLRKVAGMLIFALVVLFGFIIWNISIAPFLAVGTAVAAAVGFGAQDLVKDVIAGFFILAEDQFHIGDTVTILGVTGTVEEIQLRVTVLRDLEGNVHYVPNGKIEVTSNFTAEWARPVFDIGIAYESDVDRAIEVLLDELSQLADDPEFSDWVIEQPEVLGVNKLDDSAVVLRARMTTTADERWLVKREALRRVKNRFDAEGISIPFPQLTLNQKSENP